jgi:hypothetical protein
MEDMIIGILTIISTFTDTVVVMADLGDTQDPITVIVPTVGIKISLVGVKAPTILNIGDSNGWYGTKTD